MDLLKIVDILLGVSVVMLIMSLVVTALTEMFMGLINQKGRTLRDGLINLLAQIDARANPARMRELASDLLTHPLVADAGNRMGHVIQRHEMVELLLRIAADEPWRTAPRSRLRRLIAFLGEGFTTPTPPVRAHPQAAEVRRLLSGTGPELTAARAGEILKSVRASAVELMRTTPELSDSQRRDQALLAHFNGEFLDKVVNLFDAGIERTQARFAYPVRVYTVAAAAVLAFATQLDTLHLVNKLSVDKAFREKLVSAALDMGEHTPRPPEAVAPAATAVLAPLDEAQKKRIAELRDLGVFPAAGDWRDRLLGILITIALLTFGAPFWYDTLKNLIKLRSVLAQRDDRERGERQSAAAEPARQAAPAAGGADQRGGRADPPG